MIATTSDWAGWIPFVIFFAFFALTALRGRSATNRPGMLTEDALVEKLDQIRDELRRIREAIEQRDDGFKSWGSSKESE